jgi:hypothetical protein
VIYYSGAHELLDFKEWGKIVAKLKKNLMVLFLFVFVPICFFTCSHKQSIDIKKTEAEIWELQVTGEIVGKLKLSLKRIKIKNDIFTITGKISGRLKDKRAGTGTAEYKLEGKIEKSVFNGTFSGNSNMEVGSSPTSGTIKGMVFKSQGYGKYSVLHALGSSHGYYIMKKIHSD